MGKIKELHESEMVEHFELVLEKSAVEWFVWVGPEAHEILDLENGFTIFIFSHVFLVSLKQLHDGFEKVGTNITYCLSGHVSWSSILRAHALANIIEKFLLDR